MSQTVDRTVYEDLPEPENNRVIADLSERLEESLKALQILREERDSLTDQVESMKSNSEVSSLQ